MATTTQDRTTDNIRLNQIVDNGLNIYGSREKIRNNLIEIAKKYLNISSDSDISKASYLAYLIDMLSILTSNQIYYESKIYQEFFIVSAQMNESVQNLAKWIGYSIPKATCATANILFTLPLKFSVTPANIKFPKFFQLRAGTIPFTIKTNNNLFDSNTSASFSYDKSKLDYSTKGTVINNSAITIRDSDGFYRPIYWSDDGSYCAFNLEFEQCKWEIQTFNIPEDLQKNQFYHKNLTFDGQVADMQVYVCSPTSSYKLQLSSTDTEKVQSIEEFDPSEPITDSSGQICKFTQWTQCVNGIYTISSTSKQYDWVGYYNKGIISFGNGILGKQPEPGSFVVCVLKITKGSDGNVINGTINDGDPLEIELGTDGAKANVDYGVINNNAAYGGVDILTTSEVKNNAIVNLKTRQRLVTDDDYENIKTVVKNTTLSDCLPILKRSDIKVNEIALYFILNYVNQDANEIVPTRNATIDISDPIWDSDHQMLIPKNTKVKVGDLDYTSIFDITIDQTSMMAYYRYTCTNVDGVASELYTQSVYDSLSSQVYITSTTSNFTIDTTNTKVINNTYPLDIKWNINHIPNKVLKEKSDDNYVWTVGDYMHGLFEITQFKSYMITKWDKDDVYTELSDGYYDDFTKEDAESDDGVKYATKKYNAFIFRIPSYTTVPQGKQRFELQIMCLAPKTDGDGNVYCIDHDTCVEKIGIYKDGSTYRRNADVDVVSELVLEWKIIKKYYSDVTICQDLRSCMQSTVTVDNFIKGIPYYEGVDQAGKPIEKKIYHVHEVPTIYEPYYTSAMNKTNSDFELTVLQKLMENINFSSKRMMTDFTNIKFADTYGPMYNLRYNNVDYTVESRYSHTPWWNKQQSGEENVQVAFPDDIARENPLYEDVRQLPIEQQPAIIYYIINGKLPDTVMGQSVPVSSYMGHIAARTYSVSENGGIQVTYSVIEPEVGCCINIKDELDKDGNMQTCFWTGREWKSVDEYTVPLTVQIKVQVDDNKVAMSDDALRERIITVLSEYYNSNDKMGLQKTVDRSEIIRVCRAIDGVQYVDVVEPAFDIKFNYEVDNLTQKQLLQFTPQYVGMRTVTNTNPDYMNTSIQVDIVRK